MYLAGVDGNKKGWSVAINNNGSVTIEQHPTIMSIFAAHSQLQVMAIDMIIGIPTRPQKGGRAADQVTRKLLSPRGSVVFSTPCRAAVYAQSYQEALKLSRNASPQQIGLSKQSYNITPKIREIDQFLRNSPPPDCQIFETHPELGFWEMNQRLPVPSKHKLSGIETRKALLESFGFPLHFVQTIDDLDALACLWSAQRQLEKKAHSLFPSPPRDDFGLAMQITW